jgi:hypothetical protein
MEFLNLTVSRIEFYKNLRQKINDPNFTDDLNPLLKNGISYSPEDACSKVTTNLLAHL